MSLSGTAFIAVPNQQRPPNLDTTGYAFSFTDINVNAQVGVTVLTVEERTDSGRAKTTFYIGKYPHGFYFGDFHPSTLDGSGHASINPGDGITLSWSASEGAGYTLLYDNNDPIDVTNVRSWPDKPLPLSRDTTFYLKASLTASGNTIEHYLATSVTVTKPILETTAITTSQLTFTDSPTITSDKPIRVTAPVLIEGPLTITGLTYAQGDLTVKQAGAQQDKLTTSGQNGVAVNGDTSITGGLVIEENAVAKKDLKVSGTLDAEGDLTSNGRLLVSQLADILGYTPTQLDIGTYQSSTGGLVLAEVWTTDLDDLSFGQVGIEYAGHTRCATAARPTSPDHHSFNDEWRFWCEDNSVLLPIASDSAFTLSFSYDSEHPAASYQFFWYPLGSSKLVPVKTKDSTPTAVSLSKSFRR